MIKLIKKRLLRNIFLAKAIDEGYWLLFTLIISKIPFFKRISVHDKDKYKLKMNLINNNENVGHALSWRKIYFYLFGIKLSERKLKEGLPATIEQFYFSRSLNYIQKFIAKNNELKQILKNSFIFDPGCGCGKHLLYLKDHYSTKIVGIDVYKPAIEAAKRADYLNEAKFINASSLDLNLLQREITEKIDILLIDSWLKHVKDNKDLDVCLNFIINKSRFALLVIGKKEHVLYEKFFSRFKVLSSLKTPESEIVFLNLQL